MSETKRPYRETLKQMNRRHARELRQEVASGHYGNEPRIAYRCPNCGQVDARAEQCPSNPARYEHK